MRLLHLLSQSAIWMVGVSALIGVTDLTAERWAPMAVPAMTAGASLVLSKAFPRTRSFVRDPKCFSRPSRAEACDYASHAAMSPGMGGIQR